MQHALLQSLQSQLQALQALSKAVENHSVLRGIAASREQHGYINSYVSKLCSSERHRNSGSGTYTVSKATSITAHAPEGC